MPMNNSDYEEIAKLLEEIHERTKHLNIESRTKTEWLIGPKEKIADDGAVEKEINRFGYTGEVIQKLMQINSELKKTSDNLTRL